VSEASASPTVVVTSLLDSLPPAQPVGPQPLQDVIGLESKARLDDAERQERMRRSFKLPFPSAAKLIQDRRPLWAGETVAICGGGPSLEDTLPELLALIAAGAKVAAVNSTHDYLIDRGIVPTFGVMSDPKPWVAQYQTPTLGVKYLLASACHDDTFARFKGHPGVFIWHALGCEADRDVVDEMARKTGAGAISITGGSTTGTRTIDLMALLCGFTHHHLFGFDSSSAEGRMYPYAKPHVDPVVVNAQLTNPATGLPLDGVYPTTEPMAQQAMQFELLLHERALLIANGHYPPISITVHGTGLFPDWAALRGMHANPNRGAELIAAIPTITVDMLAALTKENAA
jgi:hypothetical protein